MDSLFVGRYSDPGLTALSIVYPLQLLMIALAVGTGVGINTIMAAKLCIGRPEEANEYAGVGTPLALVMWVLFAAVCYAIMPFYARMSTGSEDVIHDVIVYGRIVCVFSVGLFAESIWTKVLQSGGDMKTPMFAQIIGAVTNIILDPLLIFGMLGLPEMGIAGAAVGTVCFALIPGSMLSVFTTDSLVISIGSAGFPIIGVSFLPMVTSLIFPVFFQAVGYSLKSSALTIIRTVVLFVPLGFMFSRFGLGYFWLTFPVTETLTSIVGAVFYNQFLKKNAPAADTRSGAA